MNTQSPLLVAAYMKIYQPSRHNREFLNAQKGLFTELGYVHFYTDQIDETREFPCLEDVVNAAHEGMPDGAAKTGAASTFQKLVLNKKQVERLRVWFGREDYSKSRMMPSLDNIAQDVLDEWMYSNDTFTRR